MNLTVSQREPNPTASGERRREGEDALRSIDNEGVLLPKIYIGEPQAGCWFKLGCESQKENTVGWSFFGSVSVYGGRATFCTF